MSQLRVLIRGLCQDFGLVIHNPLGVPTHRSGSSIDLVLASRDLPIRNLVVHDGSTCACSPNTCCPALGSDHRLITFQIALSSTVTDDSASPRWPRVCNWLPIVQALRPRLLAWTAKLSELHRDANTFSSEARRAILDVLHGKFVHMFWDAARPQTTRASRHQRVL